MNSHSAVAVAVAACTDIEAQTTLFGSVPSGSTLHRVFHQLDGATREGLWHAMADVRVGVRARSSSFGDNASLVRRRVRIRTDSAGCTGFVWRCRERNIRFSVVARRNASVQAVISRIRFDDDAWPQSHPMARRDPPDRAPRTPAPQISLFPSTQFRYWGHYTDSTLDPVAADVDMRGHARFEDNTRRLKDSGASRLPFYRSRCQPGLARHRLLR